MSSEPITHEYRAKYTDWPLILERFAALAEATG